MTIIEKYNSLEKHHKNIIKIVSIAYEQLSPLKLAEVYGAIYDKTIIGSKGKSLVNEYIGELLVKGILESGKIGYTIKRRDDLELLAEVVMDTDCVKIFEKLKETMPITTYGYQYSWSAPRNWDVVERDFRMALFTSGEAYDAIVQRYMQQNKRELLHSVQEKYLYNLDNFYLYELYNNEIVDRNLNTVYWKALNSGYEATPLINYLERNIQNYQKDNIYLTEMMLRGEEKYVADGIQYPMSAIHHFLRGEYSKSMLYFETHLKTLKKAEKKIFYLTFQGLFYIILQLKQKESVAEIRKVIESSYVSPMLFEAFAGLHQFIKFQFNEETNFINIREVAFGNKLGLSSIIFLASYYWSGKKLEEKELDKLLKYVEKRNSQGYKWLAFEGASIGAKLSNEQYYTDKFEQIAKGIDLEKPFVSMVELFKIKEDWERSLEALLMLTGGGSQENSTNTKLQEGAARVGWFLTPNRIDSLTPVEQKMTKTGKWSGGRNVAVKRMRDREVAAATEQDYRIINAFRQESYGYYGGSSYEPTPKCLKELIGHPYVFLNTNNETPIQIVERKLEVIVDKNSDNYQVYFNYNVNTEGYHLLKETPTRYAVVEATKQHIEILRLFGSGKMKIPAKGESLLMQTLKGLSKVVTVHTELVEGDDTLPILEANQQIYAHIFQMGEGFKLEIFTKPSEHYAQYLKPGVGASNLIVEVQGQKFRVSRNLKQEKKNLEKLLEECPTLSDSQSKELEWLFEDQYQCLGILLELDKPRQEGLVVLEWPKGEQFKLSKKVDFNNLTLRVQKQNDWFGLSGELQITDTMAITIEELMKYIRGSKSEFVEVSNGQFIALTKKLRKRLAELDAYLSEDKNGLKFNGLAANVVDEFLNDAGKVKTDAHWKKQIERFKEAKQYNPPVPSTFQADLRTYQTEGYRWLSQLSHWGVGACLADDMGLGKTIQSMAVLLNRAADAPALVVAPSSVSINWEQEIRKFAPTLTPILYARSNRSTVLDELKPFDVLICSYGLLQQDAEKIKKIRFSTVILDEAQAIKNTSAKRTQAAFDLQGDFKIVTTGTPIENHLGELWSIFNFINPGLLGSMGQFTERFSTPIERNQDLDRKIALKKLVQPFILRRKKSEVLDELPAKTEITLTVELSDAERSFYEALRQNAVRSLSNIDSGELGEKRFQILAEITKLRQACCHPSMIDPQLGLSSSKLDLFGEIVEELLQNNHKALVFSQFTKHLHLIEEYVKKKGINYHYLDGQTPLNQREDLVKRFQRGEGDLFLISLKAGGVGLNLTAADYVIHMDPWWNPAVEDQASDRAHRIGQQRPVTVYRLITQNTIEEKIVGLHATKRDLADSLLEGTDSSGKLSAEELLNLIRLQ